MAPESRFELIQAENLDDVREALIGDDLGDIIYFYAHGGQDEESQQPYLEVGTGDRIHLNDFDAWRVNFPHGPLVVLNACESAAYSPDSFENLINYFCRRMNASAVIGTQCQVGELLASDFIESFFCTFYRITIWENFHSKSNVLAIRGDYQISDIKKLLGNLFCFSAIDTNLPNLRRFAPVREKPNRFTIGCPTGIRVVFRM